MESSVCNKRVIFYTFNQTLLEKVGIPFKCNCLLRRECALEKAQCYYFNGDPYEASADPCMQHQNSTYIFKRIFVAC